MPATTMLGLDNAPCEIPGHGWVSAEAARAIITTPGSIWSTMIAHPATGTALGFSATGYTPTAAMRRHVIAVDGTCRAPGCAVPAMQCDLDHDIPYRHTDPQHGGTTTIDNLTAKHRAHHRAKTSGLHQVHRDPATADLTWTTPAGRTYTTHPKDWFDGARPDDDPPF